MRREFIRPSSLLDSLSNRYLPEQEPDRHQRRSWVARSIELSAVLYDSVYDSLLATVCLNESSAMIQLSILRRKDLCPDHLCPRNFRSVGRTGSCYAKHDPVLAHPKSIQTIFVHYSSNTLSPDLLLVRLLLLVQLLLELIPLPGERRHPLAPVLLEIPSSK